MNLCILLLYCCHYYHITLLGDRTFVRSMTPRVSALRSCASARCGVPAVCAVTRRSTPVTFNGNYLRTKICCRSRSTNIFLSWVSRVFKTARIWSSTVGTSVILATLFIGINESPNGTSRARLDSRAWPPSKRGWTSTRGRLATRDHWGGSIFKGAKKSKEALGESGGYPTVWKCSEEI